MTNSQRLATVRAHLQQWLSDNIVPQAVDSAAERGALETEVSDQPAAADDWESGSTECADGIAAESLPSESLPSESIAPQLVAPQLNGAGQSAPIDQSGSLDHCDCGEVGAESKVDFAAQKPVWIVSESIMIRDGFYAGRTFKVTAHGEAFRATWFMEQDELKIHNASGQLLASLQGEEIVDHDDSESTISIAMPILKRNDSAVRDSDDEGQISRAA